MKIPEHVPNIRTAKKRIDSKLATCWCDVEVDLADPNESGGLSLNKNHKENNLENLVSDGILINRKGPNQTDQTENGIDKEEENWLLRREKRVIETMILAVSLVIDC